MTISRNSRQRLRTFGGQVEAAQPIDIKYLSENQHPNALKERQHTTSDDLQNILYSIDVATLFLDTDLNIRFFTPATRSLFGFVADDVGPPVASFWLLAP